MLYCKTLCFSILTLILLASVPSCKKKNNARFISDTDTTYSADIRSISKKINESPENAELYYRRSNAFFQEDNFKQALLDIDFAIHLDSVNPLYYFYKGNYMMAGDTANALEAEKQYSRALSLVPSTNDGKNLKIDIQFELAKLLLAKQKYNESKAMYMSINKVDPSNPAPYFFLGMIAKEQGDTTTAIQLFERTLVYDDKHYNAIMQLGNIYAEWKDKRALELFDKALKINAYSDEAQYAKGLYLQRENKFKDAVILYESVARLNPAHILCRYNLGYIHGLFGDYNKAITYLDQAIDLSPEYADAYTLRGAMKEKTNNNTGAYNDYKMALQLDPKQRLAEDGLKRINITISMP